MLTLHKTYGFLYVIIVVLLVVGCSTSPVRERKSFKSYTVGRAAAAATGEIFLAVQEGFVEKVQMDWHIKNIREYNYHDILRKEFLYSGKSGNTIEVIYQEFREGDTTPAYAQNLKYNLGESNVIQFQQLRIEIIKADEQEITFKVLDD